MHAQMRLLVEARHRSISRLEYRVGHAAAVLQRGLHRLDAVRILVVARRDAEGFLEAPLQVKPASAPRLRELGQRDALALAAIEVRLCFLQPGFHAVNVTLRPPWFYPLLAQPAMVRPPDTEITCPVMKPASSDARKATIPGMSSGWPTRFIGIARSEEHTTELQSPDHLVCRLLLEKK